MVTLKLIELNNDMVIYEYYPEDKREYPGKIALNFKTKERIFMKDSPEDFNRPVYVLKDSKLISYYQGRMYESAGIFEEDMTTINIRSLGEYFSEGYREYIINTNNLRDKDVDLYNFIKELI